MNKTVRASQEFNRLFLAFLSPGQHNYARMFSRINIENRMGLRTEDGIGPNVDRSSHFRRKETDYTLSSSSSSIPSKKSATASSPISGTGGSSGSEGSAAGAGAAAAGAGAAAGAAAAAGAGAAAAG